MSLFDPRQMSANALEEFRDWDFSFGGIFEYLANLGLYHIERQGFVGLLGIVVLILAILIAYPPTRYLGSQLASNLIQSVFSVFNLLVLGTGLLIASSATRLGQGALRNFGRSMADWARKRK